MKSFYDLLTSYEGSSALLELDGKSYGKEELIEKVGFFREQLLNLYGDWEKRLVYLDMKERINFIFLFFALSSLGVSIVLLPVEVDSRDFLGGENLFITDNKEDESTIFVTTEGELRAKEVDFSALKTDDNDNSLYLYTSGSTGRARMIPKGVHHLLVELEELKSFLAVEKGELFYFTSPLYHIYGLLFGLLLPIYAGATTIIDYHFTPESVCDFVESREVEHFISIPSYYNFFKKIDKINVFKKCRCLVSSSAPLPVELSRSFLQEDVKIREIYGSTETGGIAHRVGAIDLNWQTFSYVNIIKKRADYESRELFIESPAISIDYSDIDGYNTGDIVIFNSAGNFQLTGRNKSFIKVGGKRVNLNFVLVKYKSYLKEVTGKIIDDHLLYIGEKNGRIFLISEESFPGTSLEVKTSMKRYLPGYAVPKLLLHMKIPRNSMGKINRKEIDNLLSNLI